MKCLLHYIAFYMNEYERLESGKVLREMDIAIQQKDKPRARIHVKRISQIVGMAVQKKQYHSVVGSTYTTFYNYITLLLPPPPPLRFLTFKLSLVFYSDVSVFF